MLILVSSTVLLQLRMFSLHSCVFLSGELSGVLLGSFLAAIIISRLLALEPDRCRILSFDVVV
jgi:hypothetical protein